MPAHRPPHSPPSFSKGILMKMEQRGRYMEEIQKLEGLLAYAVAHGDKAEEERIRAELVRMVEAL